jgi:beta-aspartyl-peptidase (threonine type)
MGGCVNAAARGAELLRAGGAALDAVQAAVRELENDPLFNAGTGACLTEDGLVELDAAIMEGASLRAGAICALPPFRNPIDVARAVLEEERHVMYAGEGAAAFAVRAGFTRLEADAMITERARSDWRAFLRSRERKAPGSAPPADERGGTVGAVARDARGVLAAATSTGGTLGKARGRVGDSPIVGAGTLADQTGAASATGHGEGILRVTLGRLAVECLGAGLGPEEAARGALEHMAARVGVQGGIIVVDSGGRLGWARSTASMSWAASWDGLPSPEGGT